MSEDPTKLFQGGVEEVALEWTGMEMGQAQRLETVADVRLQIDPDLEEKIRVEFYNKINPAVAVKLSKPVLIKQINDAVSEIVDQHSYSLNWAEQSSLSISLFHDMLGVGPLEILLKDTTVTDILVNGHDNIFVERHGILEKTEHVFRNDQHLGQVARRIAASIGRRIDESSPMVDARLPDGSRVNIIIPPLSVHGTIVSIRKFPAKVISLYELSKTDAMSEEIAAFLAIAAEARLNILISGGTGSGKTTFLNAMSCHIRNEERVVTIEDAAEINLQKPHVISLETREKNIEGNGEVSQRELLRNALRMRPDRIIIGEVRGAEAHEMLQAMNTGHDGSMSTIHANSPRDALNRLEDLILSHYSTFRLQTIRRQIVSSLDLLIHLAKDIHGHRYVKSVTEIVGQEAENITLLELYSNGNEGDNVVTAPQKPLRPVGKSTIEKIRNSGLSEDLRRLCDD